MDITKIVLLTVVVALGLFLLINLSPRPANNNNGNGQITPKPISGEDNEVKEFKTQDELNAFIKYNAESSGYGYDRYYKGAVLYETMAADSETGAAVPEATNDGASQYSTTNIQVGGVDEADIVKNDGKYIYVVSGKKVVIVDAYPAENAEILSEIEFNESPSEIYINGDKLIVFTQDYNYNYNYDYYGGSDSVSVVNVYDISDRKNPKLEEKIEVDGNYFDSRMINDYVYVVVNEPVYYRPCFGYDDILDPECLAEDIGVPQVKVDGTNVDKGFPKIYYWDIPDDSYRFTTILAVNSKTGKTSKKVFVMGSSQDMFVSTDNIYVTRSIWMSEQEIIEKVYNELLIPRLPDEYQKRIEDIEGANKTDTEKKYEKLLVIKEYAANLNESEQDALADELYDEMEKMRAQLEESREQTAINKIAISADQIVPVANGKVPGNVLNQFSMDEYDGNFRIATTIGHVSRSGGGTSNNVYILDKDLRVIGKLEDLAEGEKIYSARFMGKRCYLVTFKKVDPLFVINLADPENPKVLGKLKIPGYSDYLHPYDENHLIGLGKETVEAEEGEFAWYQGIKLSLFDVSDVEKPKEIDKYKIGDRGTDSEALYEHKAFLFSKSKNLLVIPITLAEIDEEKYPQGVSDNTYGDYTWQGAYVFNIDENGFELKGRVSHVDDPEEFEKSGYYYRSSSAVRRSLYMDDTLYTLSEGKIKMNNLDTLKELNTIDLPYDKEDDYFPYLV